MILAEIVSLCEQHHCIFLEPRTDFDGAIRGFMLEQSGPRIIYSFGAVCNVFRRRDGMGWHDAREWVAFNVEPPCKDGWPAFVVEIDEPEPDDLI